MIFALAAAFAIVFVVRWRQEPRRLSNGVFAVLAVGFGLLAGASLGGPLAVPFGIVILVLCLVAALSMPVAALFLMINGVVMLTRERPTAGNLVGLAAGLGLVGIMVGTVVLLTSGLDITLVIAAWLSVVTSYFAFVFVCFAAYCLLYARRGRRRPVEAVVILGSGVRDGRVSPLLAARLSKAVTVRDDHIAAGWPPPLLVPSGGQGPDEIEPEGESMARWLRDHGVPEEAILVEARARNTEQNLRFSAALVAERSSGPRAESRGGSGPRAESRGASGPRAESRGVSGPRAESRGASGPRAESRGASRLRSTVGEEGSAVGVEGSTVGEEGSAVGVEGSTVGESGPPVTGSTEVVPVPAALAVVTNDYHAFRTALQARRLGLAAEAVGARTASYFVPSAYLREFVAVLREHRWLHVTVVAAITVGIGLLAWNVLW